MSTTTGKTLNLVKPALTDDHKVTIGTDLPANFQKIDDVVSEHLADLVTDADGTHGLKIEKGTFTPFIFGSTTAGTHVYLQQRGFYKKIGTRIFIDITLTTSTVGAMEGEFRIGGLPVVSENIGYKVYSCSIADTTGYVSSTSIKGKIKDNASYITLSGITSINNNSSLMLSANYETV